ncbi:gfo/Idh/MocA family oxidoreductase [Virgibacillus dakarensis]|uniref:Oxidoreductase n=1 Tax=Lentibacillus populi TaxID=1827502 RepID=A0A9W5TW26_9BACI|nr:MULTISPECIES: Gfo/Idh/MocA family oxidoreductase [Bacillaceae]MTW87478.1 gfo/Idh/MocA family oxidoreductase [Virgibacillus dakarensis]GGB35812.1 oxidoreductase [Lentibacillus populi]
MKIGIIGGGFGLRVQAQIIETHPAIEVTAVSTITRHQLPKELNNWNNPPKHYKDWKEMLAREELDICFVSSLPIHHYEMVRYALLKRIHVVCEKPFTMNSRESQALVELSKECQTEVFVDFEWRYLPVRQKIKKLIQENKIGEPLHYEYHITSPQYVRLSSNIIGWMGRKENFGGMLGALGSHMIDCIRWLSGDEMTEMNGFVHTHVPQGAGETRNADDAFFIHGKTTRHATFSIQLLSGITHGFGTSLRIYGSAGTITLTGDKQLCYGKANEQLIVVDAPAANEIPSHLSTEASAYYPAFFPFIDKVYEYIAYHNLDPDLPLIEDGHENQRLLDKVLAM